MSSKPQAVTLDDIQLTDVPASLKGRLEVESTDGHTAIGVESDGFLITNPYAAVGDVGPAEPSEYGLTNDEADFIVASNEKLSSLRRDRLQGH